jgi:hypothetical protein
VVAVAVTVIRPLSEGGDMFEAPSASLAADARAVTASVVVP